MTKIMSASLVMFLLCNNQVKSMNKLTLQQKLAIQQQRLQLVSQLQNWGNDRNNNQHNDRMHDDNVQEVINCDMLLSSRGISETWYIEGNKRVGIASGGSSITINVSGNDNKLEFFLRNARGNGISIDVSKCVKPEIILDIGHCSGGNGITIYTWDDILLGGSNCGGGNIINVYSPLRKFIWPTITIGLIIWLGSKFFGK